MLTGILSALIFLLGVLGIVIFVQVVISWLVVFNVLNTRSAGVRAFINGIDRVTEPLYRPLRRILPNIGSIDIAPLVVVIIIVFLRSYLLPGILMEVGPTIT